VAHIAFDVSNIQAAIEASAPYGVLPIAPPITHRTGGPNEGAMIVYMRDPDGIMLEFLQPPARKG
jgi:catechol 2,3-dioxygenase-like lactoylglutathione lyase family enzyme